MRILTGTWQDDFLDEALLQGCARVEARLLVNVEPVEGAYFVRARRVRTLWNYAREVGVRRTLLKVRSRQGERLRNVKWVSTGVGRVLDAGDGSAYTPGDWVVFAASSHPVCAERFVLSDALLKPLSQGDEDRGVLRHRHTPTGPAPVLETLPGWTPHSGAALPTAEVAALHDLARLEWSRPAPTDAEFATGSPVSETRHAERARGARPRAVLFGYGNYAKTVILPAMSGLVDVARVHEIDPTQIGSAPAPGLAWDTSPLPRSGEAYDAWLIAGYHHTHAPLAIQALRSGAAAIVEKPPATTQEQLAELLAAMDDGGRLFTCYQKRYSPLNDLARHDLDVRPGDPINYHCIVFEEKLPSRHWYRWPNSRTRLTSNGCHWLDHFLHLNPGAAVRWSTVHQAHNGDVAVAVELENDAFFTMALTDHGSPRIGLQDRVELRAGERQVRIENGARYEAEGDSRILRRRRANRLDSHALMYRRIAESVVRGEHGDSAAETERSMRLVLDLEAKLGEGSP